MRSCSFSEAGLWTTVRLGLAMGAGVGAAVVWKRENSPQPARASEAHNTAAPGKARDRRLTLASRRPTPSTTTAILTYLADLVAAHKFDLSHLKRFNSRTAMCLNEAPDTNTFVFERLRRNAGGLKNGARPPWNSHSKVPCPVPAEVQVSGSPRLPDRKNLAFDQRK